MKNLSFLLILVLFFLVATFVYKTSETFEIEPNTIMGGYNSGPADFELDGPGYPDGY
jgi:hypothetical protein